MIKRSVTRSDFRFLQRLLYETTGVRLDDSKEYLVASRLGSLCYKRSVELGELIAAVRREPELRGLVIDLLLNHETSFFRDWDPFQGIRDQILPDLCEGARERGERTLRIWCAACSSGQEPYSLAMVCAEALDLSEWNVEISATDVSLPTLEVARQGSYTALDVNRGLPSASLLRHFEQDGIHWRVKRELRELVSFRQLNLVAEEWPVLPPFDLILLRNVLIYFDMETRGNVIGRVKSALSRTGYVLLGGAELTMNLTRDFELRRIGKTIYFRLK